GAVWGGWGGGRGWGPAAAALAALVERGGEGRIVPPPPRRGVTATQTHKNNQPSESPRHEADEGVDRFVHHFAVIVRGDSGFDRQPDQCPEEGADEDKQGARGEEPDPPIQDRQAVLRLRDLSRRQSSL